MKPHRDFTTYKCQVWLRTDMSPFSKWGCHISVQWGLTLRFHFLQISMCIHSQISPPPNLVVYCQIKILRLSNLKLNLLWHIASCSDFAASKFQCEFKLRDRRLQVTVRIRSEMSPRQKRIVNSRWGFATSRYAHECTHNFYRQISKSLWPTLRFYFYASTTLSHQYITVPKISVNSHWDSAGPKLQRSVNSHLHLATSKSHFEFALRCRCFHISVRLQTETSPPPNVTANSWWYFTASASQCEFALTFRPLAKFSAKSRWSWICAAAYVHLHWESAVSCWICAEVVRCANSHWNFACDYAALKSQRNFESEQLYNSASPDLCSCLLSTNLNMYISQILKKPLPRTYIFTCQT